MLIAICDDERQELNAIVEIFSAAAVKLPVDMEIAAYSSGAALLEAVEDGVRPDLAVLDIYMSGLNGMETASSLRRSLPELPIAFLTTSRDFAVEAFALGALHYMVKPVTTEKTLELLRRLPPALLQAAPRCLELVDRRETLRFPLEEVRYILSQDKGVEVHTVARRKWVFCPFREVLERLEGELDFLQISRSCIVNLNDVLHLGHSGFHMKDGKTLSISRRGRQEAQNRYNDFLFRKMSQIKETLL